MRPLYNIIAIVLIAGLLQGCANMNKQAGGSLIGGLVGAGIGSQFGGGTGKVAATAGGALLGALAGGMIGGQMDEQDRQIAALTAQRALESAPVGRQVAWNNPDNGHSGYITPTRTYREAGNYCREYQQTVIINGKAQKAYGKACRMPDGSWKIIN